MEKPTKTAHSFEIKKQVVQRYLAGETGMDLAAEFHLSSNALVQTWVRAWRQGGDEALMPKPRGRPKGAAFLAQDARGRGWDSEARRPEALVAQLDLLIGEAGTA